MRFPCTSPKMVGHLGSRKGLGSGFWSLEVLVSLLRLRFLGAGPGLEHVLQRQL